MREGIASGKWDLCVSSVCGREVLVLVSSNVCHFHPGMATAER